MQSKHTLARIAEQFYYWLSILYYIPHRTFHVTPPEDLPHRTFHVTPPELHTAQNISCDTSWITYRTEHFMWHILNYLPHRTFHVTHPELHTAQNISCDTSWITYRTEHFMWHRLNYLPHRTFHVTPPELLTAQNISCDTSGRLVSPSSSVCSAHLVQPCGFPTPGTQSCDFWSLKHQLAVSICLIYK